MSPVISTVSERLFRSWSFLAGKRLPLIAGRAPAQSRAASGVTRLHMPSLEESNRDREENANKEKLVLLPICVFKMKTGVGDVALCRSACLGSTKPVLV